MKTFFKISLAAFTIFVFLLPKFIHDFKRFKRAAREVTPKLELKSLQVLQNTYFAENGKYSYDLQTLGYVENNQVIVGFSKRCQQTTDSQAKIFRSYQISNQPQRWHSGDGECNKTVDVQNDREVEQAIDEIFDSDTKCLELEKGFEATAIVSVCGNYGIYRISEVGEVETIKSLAPPFSYLDFIKSFL